MNSYRLVLRTVPCLLLALAFASHASPAKALTAITSSQKVNLSVYYDSLCLRCANFIVKELEGVFENDLISITNLRLVPWGNAHLNKSETAHVCQQGQDECQLNRIQGCAIDTFNTVDKYYALIYCIEFLAIEGRQKWWETCFDSLGLPKKKVLDCYNSSKGKMLAQGYANETAHVTPPHTFLPWVVVNNQPISKDYANFEAYICRAYEGRVLPAGCK